MSKKQEKSIGIAYLSWFGCILYINGLQRFYLGRTMEGWIYLLTLGFFGIGQIADLFFIPYMLNEKNRRQVIVEEAIKPNNNITQTVNINSSNEDDFFNSLQEKENKQGKKVRGGGHGWTTFTEILIGDW